MTRGMGDVQDPSLRETLLQWEHLGRHPFIIKPNWVPPRIEGLADVQQLIDRHLMPRLWQLIADYPQLLQKFPLRVQPPGWLEPPFSADPEDLCSEDPVALSNTDFTTVIQYEVPDRHIVSFRSFGHMLTVTDQWGTVEWSILVNKKPVRTYFKFKQQRGVYAFPTPLASPIKLKGKDLIQVVAKRGGTAVSATARLQGWVIAAGSVTQDGTAKDWNVR